MENVLSILSREFKRKQQNQILLTNSHLWQNVHFAQCAHCNSLNSTEESNVNTAGLYTTGCPK